MTGHSLKECFCVQEGVMLAAVLKRDILDSRYVLEVVFTGLENGLHVGVADRMGGGESVMGGGFWNKGLDGWWYCFQDEEDWVRWREEHQD